MLAVLAAKNLITLIDAKKAGQQPAARTTSYHRCTPIIRKWRGLGSAVSGEYRAVEAVSWCVSVVQQRAAGGTAIIYAHIPRKAYTRIRKQHGKKSAMNV